MARSKWVSLVIGGSVAGACAYPDFNLDESRFGPDGHYGGAAGAVSGSTIGGRGGEGGSTNVVAGGNTSSGGLFAEGGNATLVQGGATVAGAAGTSIAGTTSGGSTDGLLATAGTAAQGGIAGAFTEALTAGVSSVGGGAAEGGGPSASGGATSATGGASTCDPNTYFCDLGSVPESIRLCSQTGVGSSLFQPCAVTQYCNVDASSSVVSCKDMLCSPNQPACNNGVATFCNARGAGYVAGGNACKASEICVSGACKTVICTANADFCDTAVTPNQIRTCNAWGTDSSPKSPCAASEYCDSTSATCKPQVCTPSQPVCSGNSATTCNVLGSAPNPGGTDCVTAQEMFCVNNACGYKVDNIYLNPVGTNGTPDHDNNSAYNFYSVTESRTLRKIEMYLFEYKSAQTISWRVLAASAQTGSYAQIFSTTTTTTASGGTSVYETTGPINVKLVAGTFYAIGVELPPSVAGPNETVKAWVYGQGTAAETVSFGTMFSGKTSGTYYNGTVANHYSQRLNTGP